MTEPSAEQKIEVVHFWDGQKYRFCPNCQDLAFKFAAKEVENV